MAEAAASEPIRPWKRYANCVRLNLRVARLAVTGRWLTREDTRASYDRLAPAYDDAWLRHLAPVTQDLLDRIPEPPPGGVLDLGCGTGLTVERLAKRWPGRPLTAVDISGGMLDLARRRPGAEGVRFEQADMLDVLRRSPAQSFALIVAAWSIGYSRPARVIAGSGRALRPGGLLAFVVNYADSLAPIRRAFRRTMGWFPDEVRCLAWPRFPAGADLLRRALARAQFESLWWRDGHHPIEPRVDDRGRLLPWLLQTGVLAGFDAKLPLDHVGPVADAFERFLQADGEPIRHHYAAAIARRRS